MPVKARNSVSCRTDCDSDEASDPKKKMANPVSKTTLRDQMSESLP